MLRRRNGMSIEDATPRDVIVEAADTETEQCPACESENWLRAIAGYDKGACWVIFCADCGKTLDERWNMLP